DRLAGAPYEGTVCHLFPVVIQDERSRRNEPRVPAGHALDPSYGGIEVAGELPSRAEYHRREQEREQGDGEIERRRVEQRDDQGRCREQQEDGFGQEMRELLHSFAAPVSTICLNIFMGITTETLEPHSGQRKSSMCSLDILPQFAHISTVFFSFPPAVEIRLIV